MTTFDFAVVIPMANEADSFEPFVTALSQVLDGMECGTAYLVIDTVSTDETLELARALSRRDERFKTVYEPKNKNVVDAYLRGYREAYNNGHPFIIEMDAGLSHDPRALPRFLAALGEGNECVFGSRFMSGGSMRESNFKRRFLSRFGTALSNTLLGSRLQDMTSGYQGFNSTTVKQILDYGLLSKAHFYQTEVRYLLRQKKFIEIPIHYKAPSPRVSQGAIADSLRVLMFYFLKRVTFKPKIIR